MNEEEAKKWAMLKLIKLEAERRLKPIEKELKEQLRDARSDNGTKQLGITVNGVDVGKVAIGQTRGAIAIDPACMEEALAYLYSAGLVQPADKWQARFEYTNGLFIDVETGEAVNFLYMERPHDKAPVVSIDEKKALAEMPPMLKSSQALKLIGVKQYG